jgi:hypothetical protein
MRIAAKSTGEQKVPGKIVVSGGDAPCVLEGSFDHIATSVAGGSNGGTFLRVGFGRMTGVLPRSLRSAWKCSASLAVSANR